MMRGLEQAAQKLGLEVEKKPAKKQVVRSQPSAQEVPMMYRAQVKGRCSLQFASEDQDLERWTEEWVDPQDQQPRYQRSRPQMGKDGTVYRFQVEFPFRLFSNCGQDSIHRPVMGKNGIPFLPGSSVKGLFRRACLKSDRQHNRSAEQSKARLYCGDQEVPGCLRFHGAYPVGNWANRMVDVVHPQQKQQVQGEGTPNALALISLYRPEMVFEFSSQNTEIDWQEVRWLLVETLQFGVGGKTSTGYGLGGNFVGQPLITPNYPIRVELKVVGVSSLLRTDVPEFRPNMFKASLRGHVLRLLAGVCTDEKIVQKEADRLFGNTQQPGVVQLLWQSRQPEKYDTTGKNPTYEAHGFLHLNVPLTDQDFLNGVLRFGFIMGGFGKSWRRVWHDRFYPKYKKFAIGCHWESPDLNDINTSSDLQQFLAKLHQDCADKLGIGSPKSLIWKEAWHPNRVAIYSKVVSQSAAISLFHQPIGHPYKLTPAICGRQLVVKRRIRNDREVDEEKEELVFSSVWHRMLPVHDGQYLEIMTVFHGNRKPWKHQEEDQLLSFIANVESLKFKLTWGSRPTH